MVWLSVPLTVSAQFYPGSGPPVLYSSGFLVADDGGYAPVSYIAYSTNPHTLVWTLKIGTKIWQPQMTMTSAGGESYLAFGRVGPFTLADNHLPVTLSVSNAWGTTTKTEMLIVRGLPPVFSGTGSVVPASMSIPRDQAAVFTGKANGSLPLRYQWKKEGTDIPGATDTTLRIPVLQIGDSGRYTLTASNDFGTATSPPATLTVLTLPVTITRQPESVTVPLGSPASFEVGATGSATIGYQWRKDSLNIEGATQRVLYIPSVRASDVGRYYVQLTNPGGTLASVEVTLSIAVPPPPVMVAFEQQPKSVTVKRGASATFQGVATGTAPITYQWQKDAVPIPGATQSVLTIANVEPSAAGLYRVVATNPVGSVVSDPATLTLEAPPPVPPSIARAPAHEDRLLGSALELTVTATGTMPLAFQWRKDGVPIPGATTASFALASLQPADAGSYTVTVSNVAGSTVSPPAVVSVRMPGRLVNLSVLSSLDSTGDKLTLGVVVGGAGTVGTLPLLVRAAGPSLRPFGVTDVLADPSLTVFTGRSRRSFNDDWAGAGALATVAGQVGAFPLVAPDSKDAAVLEAALEVGGHSVEIAGGAGSTGAVLGEVYDASVNFARTIATPRVVNLSVLKALGSGLTVGFVISGTTDVNVGIRAIGPSLAGFGVSTPHPDPRAEVRRADRSLLQANDDWSGDPAVAAAFESVGAFPLAAGSKDAALVTRLAPGSYTVLVGGARTPSDVILVEIYEMP